MIKKLKNKLIITNTKRHNTICRMILRTSKKHIDIRLSSNKSILLCTGTNLDKKQGGPAPIPSLFPMGYSSLETEQQLLYVYASMHTTRTMKQKHTTRTMTIQYQTTKSSNHEKKKFYIYQIIVILHNHTVYKYQSLAAIVYIFLLIYLSLPVLSCMLSLFMMNRQIHTN